MLLNLPTELILDISSKLNRNDHLRLASTCRQIRTSLSFQTKQWLKWGTFEYPKDWVISDEFRRSGHAYVETLLLREDWAEELGDYWRQGLSYLSKQEAEESTVVIKSGSIAELLKQSDHVVVNYLPLLLPRLLILDYVCKGTSRREHELIHLSEPFMLGEALSAGLFKNLAHLRLRFTGDQDRMGPICSPETFVMIVSLPSLRSLFLEALRVNHDFSHKPLSVPPKKSKLKILRLAESSIHVDAMEAFFALFEGLELFTLSHLSYLIVYNPTKLLHTIAKSHQQSLRILCLEHLGGPSERNDSAAFPLNALTKLESTTCALEDIVCRDQDFPRAGMQLPSGLRNLYLTDNPVESRAVKEITELLMTSRTHLQQIWLSPGNELLRMACERLGLNITTEVHGRAMPWLEAAEEWILEI